MSKANVYSFMAKINNEEALKEEVLAIDPKDHDVALIKVIEIATKNELSFDRNDYLEASNEIIEASYSPPEVTATNIESDDVIKSTVTGSTCHTAILGLWADWKKKWGYN